jgi:2'-5' RNA ligase
MARLFFAVWPGEEAAMRLAEASRWLAALAGGKPVPREKIHLTLAFLGELTREETDRALEVGAQMRSPPFGMALDNVGSFRGARVAWAGCSATPPALAALQSRLEEALRERGLRSEERPFVPHVTLARRIARSVPLAPLPTVEWNVRSLTLARSETGTGRYSIVEGWNLG